jgi:hypothetical protein
VYKTLVSKLQPLVTFHDHELNSERLMQYTTYFRGGFSSPPRAIGLQVNNRRLKPGTSSFLAPPLRMYVSEYEYSSYRIVSYPAYIANANWARDEKTRSLKNIL